MPSEPQVQAAAETPVEDSGFDSFVALIQNIETNQARRPPKPMPIQGRSYLTSIVPLGLGINDYVELVVEVRKDEKSPKYWVAFSRENQHSRKWTYQIRKWVYKKGLKQIVLQEGDATKAVLYIGNQYRRYPIGVAKSAELVAATWVDKLIRAQDAQKKAQAAAEPEQRGRTEVPFKLLAIALARREFPGAVPAAKSTVTEHGYTCYADRCPWSRGVVDTEYEILVPVDAFQANKSVSRGSAQYYVSFYETDRGSGIRVYSRNSRGRAYLPEIQSSVDQIFYHPNLDPVKSLLSREAGQTKNNLVRLVRIAAKLVISVITKDPQLTSMHAATEPAGAGDDVDQYLHQNHRGTVSLPGYRKFDFSTENGIAILSWDGKPVVTFCTWYADTGKRNAPVCLGVFQALQPGRHIIQLEGVLESAIRNRAGATAQQLVLKMLRHALDAFNIPDWDKQPKRYQNAEAAAEPEPKLPRSGGADPLFNAFYNLKQAEGKTIKIKDRAWSAHITSFYRGSDSPDERYQSRDTHISATLMLTTPGHEPEKIQIETWGRDYVVTVGAQHLGNRSRTVLTLRRPDFRDPVSPSSFLRTVLERLGLLEQDQVRVPKHQVPKEFVDQCVRGYIDAALGYSRLDYDDTNEDTFDSKYSYDDVAAESIFRVRGYMLKFLEHTYPRIVKAQKANHNLKPSDIGHRTYLSHTGSGGGFSEETYRGDDDLADDLAHVADAIFPGDCNLEEDGRGGVDINL
jgi:hypothetical protein